MTTDAEYRERVYALGRQATFDRALQVGARVAARWTWNFGYWCDTGVIAKLNAKSARVKLDHGASYGLSPGHVVLVPRMSDSTKWSWNNGVFPAECPA